MTNFGPATLAGGGHRAAGERRQPAGSIDVGGSHLTNEDNLIAGFGLIRDLVLTNNGTVSGDVSGQTLRLGGTNMGTGMYDHGQRGHLAT